MDMEMLSIAYPDAGTLLADLRASGQTSARADRPRGLAGRRFGERLRAGLAPRATFEVVYGHAWKGATPTARRTGPENRACFQAHALRRAFAVVILSLCS